MPTSLAYVDNRHPPGPWVTNLSGCYARKRGTEKQCGAPPIRGTHVCKVHGGMAPQVRERGQERIAQARAASFLSTQDYGPVDDPLGELLKLADEAIVAKDYFKSQIESLRYQGNTGEQLRAEVALWERAMDRCDKILSNIVRLGIQECVTRVKEAEMVLLGQALDRILDRLQLTPAQRAMSEAIVVEELEAISAPKA